MNPNIGFNPCKVVFSSTLFLLYFLPLFLLVYHVVPKVARNGVILIASLLFYAWGAPSFIFIVLLSTIVDFYLVRSMSESTDAKRRLWLVFSVVLNLGLLAYFKYANFFIENLNVLLTQMGFRNLGWTEVVLPIGISFYTFQTITYAVDVYRKTSKPLRKLTDYLLYIFSFPQLIAGPIVRFNTVAKEIENREERIDDKLLGFFRFSVGLAKKVLIANVLGRQADLIFNADIHSLSSGDAWIGILAYTFQIYFDFSGYSDMAIGIGKIIGFNFPENFNFPYIAQSVSEFWRRWHITLGDFMRNYLYIPLGGNRVNSKSRLYANLWLVFLLSGLWHGASWNFLVWGMYHGAILVLERLFLLKVYKKVGRIPAFIGTFTLVLVGWVFFRVETMPEVWSFLHKMFAFDFSDLFWVNYDFSLMLVIAIAFSFSGFIGKWEVISSSLFQTRTLGAAELLIYTVLSLLLYFLCVSVVNAEGFNPFIYFRF